MAGLLAARNSREVRDTLIRENMGLAFFALEKYVRRFGMPNLPGVDRDDLVTEAYIMLCRAAEMWIEERGAFSTFAVRCIDHRLQNMVRHVGTGIERMGPLVSLDDFVTEEEDVRRGDLIEDTTSPLDSIPELLWVRERIDSAMEQLNLRQRNLVQGHLRGDADVELAERYGISRQLAHKLRQEAYARLRWYLRQDPEFMEWVSSVVG